MDIFREKPLEGKVVFVAGGSSGINLGIAQHFARHGAKLALISRSADKIASAATSICDEGLEAIGMAADVRDFAAVDAALMFARERFGPIDIVISGAAGNFVAPAAQMPTHAWAFFPDGACRKS